MRIPLTADYQVQVRIDQWFGGLRSEDHAARPDDPDHLADRLARVGSPVEHELREYRVEAAVGIVQVEHIAFLE